MRTLAPYFKVGTTVMHSVLDLLRRIKRTIIKYKRLSNIKYQLNDVLHRQMAKFRNKRFRNSFKIQTNESSAPKFSVTFGTRFLGNRDHALGDFFKSFLENTEIPDDFEFLIKIDDDDDLGYFWRTRNKYKNLNIHFLISGRGNGYGDMHIWHDGLTKVRHKSSEFHIILTDDVRFIVKFWDKDLRNRIAKKNSSSGIILATPSTYEETVSICGPNPTTPVPIYWVQGTDFPIISFKFMSIIEKELFENPIKNWTLYGNTFNIDSYFGDLLRQMPEDSARECHLQIPLYFQRTGITSWTNNIWPGEAKKGILRNSTLLAFQLSENELIRAKFSRKIAEVI